jgi:hypothetical protein
MTEKAEQIKSKILQVYPEIGQFGLGLEISYDDRTNAWVATVTKGAEQLSTHLEEEDVESCLQGKECYHFGMQLGRFIRYYCEGGEACRL